MRGGVLNKLILDTDGGVDDAQALLILIAAGRVPDAITTVFGNVDCAAATRNILSTLAIAGVDIPVHEGAGRPLVQPIVDAKHVHGEDGLGGAPRPVSISSPTSSDGVGFLRSSLRKAAAEGDEIDLLMIGPLTNLALALVLEPSIANGIGQVTIMGGTIRGQGNTTPAAEFNIYADPEAASVVFGSGLEVVLVPWETCVDHYMTGAEVDALFVGVPETPLRSFSKALATHARQVTVVHGGGDVLRFVDILAACVVVDQSIATGMVRASVDVALAPGLTRGATISDPSRRLGNPAISIVQKANIDRLKCLYASSLRDRGPFNKVQLSVASAMGRAS